MIAGVRTLDAHVRIGAGREVHLDVDELLASMELTGIDAALVAPAERYLAVAEAEGNALTCQAARRYPGRLFPYAVANPWRGREATELLRRAHGEGAVALATDATLQGFDLHDGLLDPLLDLAAEFGWPVYVRTGTPPSGLPLPLALLARRHPHLTFVMGRSGATDFWIDAIPALVHAPNLLADTAYAPWDTVLTGFSEHPEVGAGRVVFSTDSPYTLPEAEIERVLDWPLPADRRALVLGATMRRALGLGVEA